MKTGPRCSKRQRRKAAMLTFSALDTSSSVISFNIDTPFAVLAARIRAGYRLIPGRFTVRNAAIPSSVQTGEFFGSRALLKAALGSFQSLQRIQQLQPGFLHLIRSRRELLGMLDGEPDSIYRNPRLVSHFKLDRRWRGWNLCFDYRVGFPGQFGICHRFLLAIAVKFSILERDW